MAAVTDTLINVDLIMDEAKVIAASAEAEEPEQSGCPADVCTDRFCTGATLRSKEK